MEIKLKKTKIKRQGQRGYRINIPPALIRDTGILDLDQEYEVTLKPKDAVYALDSRDLLFSGLVLA